MNRSPSTSRENANVLVHRELRSHFPVLLLAALVLAMASLGCDLLGTNDVALDFRTISTENGAASESQAETKRKIANRLTAIHLFADIDWINDKTARVVVDGDRAAAMVAAMLRWRGGVQLYALTADANASLERGSLSALRERPVNAFPPAGERTIFDCKNATDCGALRVERDPVVDLVDGIERIDRTGWGDALQLRPTEKPRAKIVEWAAMHTHARVAIARDDLVLAMVSGSDIRMGELPIRFSSGIIAFAEARDEHLLLSTPALPKLDLVHVERLKPRYGLAVSCLLIPLVVSIGWLIFVRRFDRARPEPLWLIVATFVLGALSTLPAAVLELGAMRLSPYLDPSVMTLGGQWFALPLAIAVFTISVGLVEEGVKFGAVYVLAARRPEFDEPVDGIIYACTSALGFAAAENVKYFATARLSGTLIALRTMTSVPLHMFVSALWGYGLGRYLVRKDTRALPYFLLAALLHGLFNAFASIEHVEWLAIFTMLGLGTFFTVLLRRSLRYPAVAHGEVPASCARWISRIGSSRKFIASAVAMILAGAFVVVVGVAYELLGRRVGIVFVSISAIALFLFGAAAYGVTATIPLDVAVDERALTFAGVTYPWPIISSARIETKRGWLGSKSWLRVRAGDRETRIGPAPLTLLQRIQTAIETQIGSRY